MYSLQKLCINLICKEFERFHFAFTMQNDNNLKRYFDILLRRYSFQLCSGLFEKKKLKDEYLDFLMNEHLKFLDEQWLLNSRYQNSIKDILCRLPNLTKIACFLRNDEILENIAKFCPKINSITSKIFEIDAESSFFYAHTDTCLCEKGIVSPELEEIYIDKTTVDGMKHLVQNLKSLQSFYHKNVALALYSLHKEDMPKLENVPSYNLVEMQLPDAVSSLPHYSDILKICLTVCPKLRILWCPISNIKQFDLFKDTCLENLKISVPKANHNASLKINIDGFLKNYGRNLVILTVHHFIMSLSQLASACPKLKHLFLDNITYVDHYDSKVVFPDLITCAFVRLESNEICDKAVRLLRSLTNLEILVFCFCTFSHDMKISILKCVKSNPVTMIKFMHTEVESNYVADLLQSCPSLKKLIMESSLFEEETEEKALLEFAETLPNKPCIHLSNLPL